MREIINLARIPPTHFRCHHRRAIAVATATTIIVLAGTLAAEAPVHVYPATRLGALDPRALAALTTFSFELYMA